MTDNFWGVRGAPRRDGGGSSDLAHLPRRQDLEGEEGGSRGGKKS